ncbi:NINE protein [Clostridium sp. D33t1_170424_F3]|uniref:NINE protein n=1 Tax=Clostridium sp. D33t1_170424_F3 TaxID=2787099 RepID=UPI0018AAEFA0|nr:NINE protein [Clostridium sp. D33t1_170424_F3]
MICNRCGFDNPQDVRYCKQCGADLSAQAPSAPPPYQPQPNQWNPPPPNYYVQPSYPAYMEVISPSSRWVALILCIFLGTLGIHRFYVGKIGTGILYLLTGGAFGIGWIVDIIMIACGSFTDSYGAQLKQ